MASSKLIDETEVGILPAVMETTLLLGAPTLTWAGIPPFWNKCPHRY